MWSWLSASRDRPSKPDYSKTSRGLDRQSVCKGCSRLEILLDRAQRSPAPLRGRLDFHDDFAELDECSHVCQSCRMFRQALILRCTTNEEAGDLAAATKGLAVYARVVYADAKEHRHAQGGLSLDVGITNEPSKLARFQCVAGQSEGLNLCEDPHDPRIAEQVRRWLDGCHQNHAHLCAKLRWSSANPTRLIRILGETEAQLCSVDGPPVQYAAVSYSWGTQSVTAEEAAQLKRGITTDANMGSRQDRFRLDELPPTLHDALLLFSRAGVSYAWVDSVCIIQDQADKADFLGEAPRMHEYYGNAHFTLAVCSNRKATEPLLARRSAYARATLPCRLGGRWLLPPRASVLDTVTSSPLALRAWALQEERLSPRVLYWAASTMFWSCAEATHVEAAGPSDGPSQGQTRDYSPQDLLVACSRGTSESRHGVWCSLAESYAARDLSNPDDRFAALAGLASKYLSACQTPNAYFAGLWQATLASDLSWRVKRAASGSSRPGISPSWSWASLPLRTGVQMNREFDKSCGFELLHVALPKEKRHASDQIDAISRGALATRLRVRGHLRRLWSEDVVYRPWSAVKRQTRTISGTTELQLPSFFFSDWLGQATVSADVELGTVLSYEVRKDEVAGQLDYVDDAVRITKGSLDVFALQTTPTSAVLLESLGGDLYRRVGAAVNWRPDLFEGVVAVELDIL